MAGVLSGMLVVWIRGRLFRVVVEGQSMMPALRPGDLLIATVGGAPRRGSVVMLDHPGRPGFELVKRVVAVPGDRLPQWELGPGEYWVEGDRPEASTDSRAFGPIRRDAIRGIVRARYWPPRGIGPLRGPRRLQSLSVWV